MFGLKGNTWLREGPDPALAPQVQEGVVEPSPKTALFERGHEARRRNAG